MNKGSMVLLALSTLEIRIHAQHFSASCHVKLLQEFLHGKAILLNTIAKISKLGASYYKENEWITSQISFSSQVKK